MLRQDITQTLHLWLPLDLKVTDSIASNSLQQEQKIELHK